jgi:hypothetical protein
MKKNYVAPKAEVVSFAKEDVITASGDTVFDWDMPTIDLGGDWVWSEDGGALKM